MRVLAALVLALAAMGAACSAAGPHGPAIRYVALGDSYASGEGNPPFDQGTDVQGDKCHRSPFAYSRVLRVGNPVVLVHRACSGATVKDLTGSRFGEPPQLSWVDSRADVVTFTIGGNNALFQPIIAACTVAGSRCDDARPVVQAAIDSMSKRLIPLLEQARQLAPHARVLLVDYPQIFPDPFKVKVDGCGTLNFRGFGIDGEAETWMRGMLQQLDETLQGIASTAGVEFVDEYSAFAGHELCTSTPWVFGIGHTASLHPDAAGQKALAKRVAAVLQAAPI